MFNDLPYLDGPVISVRSLQPILVLALAAPAAAGSSDLAEAQAAAVEFAQLTVRERVVIRVRRLPSPVARPDAPPPVTWKEKGGARCVAVGDLAGALVTQPDAVDLVLNGGERLRARLSGECKPLDFYSGFYLKPSADGQVCAGRDTVRARSGATCPIKQFRKLKAQRGGR